MFTKPTTTALAALALAGLLGACGDDVSTDAGPASIDESAADDSGDDSGGGGGAVSNEDRQDAVLEYAQCMRDQGIDMPDPEVTSNGGIAVQREGDGSGGGPMGPRDDEEFQAAEAECGDIMEDVRGDMEAADPEEVAERQDQMVALAQCMRDKGHDFPDPQVDDSGRVQINVEDDSGGPGAERSEDFESDMEDCRDELGLEGPGEGGMTSRSEG